MTDTPTPTTTDAATDVATEAAFDTDAARPRGTRELLETIGGTLAIAAAILPATGFAARLTALAFLPLDSNSRWLVIISWSAPLPELLLWGFIASLIALAIFALQYGWTAAIAHPAVRARPQPSRRATRIVRFSGLALLVIWLAFTPSFPAFFVLLPFFFVVSVAIGPATREGRRLRLIEFWWAVALFLLVGGVTLGLTGIAPSAAPANYQFRAEAQTVVADGKYDQLGDGNGYVALLNCTTRKIAVVKEEEVITVVPVPASRHDLGPSLFDVVVNHRAISLGYQAC